MVGDNRHAGPNPADTVMLPALMRLPAATCLMGWIRELDGERLRGILDVYASPIITMTAFLPRRPLRKASCIEKISFFR